MSNYRVRQVLALGEMPRRQLRFLVALATYLGDESRSVRVGFAALADTSGLSGRWAKVTRSELSDAGRIAYVPGRYRGDLTLWTALCLPEKGGTDVVPPSGNKGAPDSDPLPKGAPDDDPLTAGKGAPNAGERGHLNGAEGGTLDRPDQHEPERRLNLLAKPSSPRLADPYAALPGFADFYATYPRHVGKRAAADAYRRAVNRCGDPQALLLGAKRYAAERERQDPKFTKHPATWLNGDCWADGPATVPAGDREDDSWLR